LRDGVVDAAVSMVTFLDALPEDEHSPLVYYYRLLDLKAIVREYVKSCKREVPQF